MAVRLGAMLDHPFQFSIRFSLLSVRRFVESKFDSGDNDEMLLRDLLNESRNERNESSEFVLRHFTFFFFFFLFGSFFKVFF